MIWIFIMSTYPYRIYYPDFHDKISLVNSVPHGIDKSVPRDEIERERKLGFEKTFLGPDENLGLVNKIREAHSKFQALDTNWQP